MVSDELSKQDQKKTNHDTCGQRYKKRLDEIKLWILFHCVTHKFSLSGPFSRPLTANVKLSWSFIIDISLKLLSLPGFID